MGELLLYAKFRWVEDAANFDVSAIALDSPTGYILEADLEYLQLLHDRHTDLPFCPTCDKPSGKREHKLLATLYDKQHYIIHYRNLQQCTRHGLHVTRSIGCYNSRNLHGFAITLNLIQISERARKTISKKFCIN